VRVLAEVLFARIGKGDLRFQVARFALDGRGEPDRVVREYADLRIGEPDDLRVVHSTSWRYERAKIVLTYLVYSDRLRFRGRARRARIGALPGAEEAARNGKDRDRQVAAHALRHLALLVAEDPKTYEGKIGGGTRRTLRRLRPAAAGRVRHRQPGSR
jgi:hypothetical protein